ncbi:MAG: 2-hydroxy-3-oxopropionate reductase [Atribacterota bacterium]|nr:2-hydroxy-3-oxopropionate reductase [Atribacterota bacterium]MDD4895696.1 2-hydroxy-3-oxopropionate reductase [Atribacterota bacterium]MDD5636879.1 2-hydroxy-3-oxopropionate reductase [Atribacterota bacterium]
MSKPKIGFIGIGIMGFPMAKNLLKAGYPLIAYDINQEALYGLTKEGADRGESCAQVAKNCDIIITMLPNSPDVQKAILSKQGILEGARQGQILIDMSSIAPLVSQALARELAKKGIDMLDAPVSGGQEKAQLGTLAIMVGGKEEIFHHCKPILEVMGKPVLVGDIGAGGTTKLVNQAIVAVNIAIVAEALLLGKKAGVDPERIFEAIRGGLAGSQCLTDKAPRMFSGNYDPGFRMRLHVKDLTNVLQTSQELHNTMPLTAQVMEMMQALMADGHTEVDHAGLALFYEKMNGISLRKE